MSPHKIKHEIEFIPYADAVPRFKSETDLLNALKDGKVVAFGDHYPDPSKEQTNAHVLITPWCWQNYSLKNGSLFGGVDEHGSDDPEEFRNIVLEASSFAHHQTAAQGRGAPPKYDWEGFWMAVAYHLHSARNDDGEYFSPVSLRDWARNAATDYDYIWNSGDTPSETTVEDKLRPLWKAMKEESDAPLRQTIAAKNTSGGK